MAGDGTDRCGYSGELDAGRVEADLSALAGMRRDACVAHFADSGDAALRELAVAAALAEATLRVGRDGLSGDAVRAAIARCPTLEDDDALRGLVAVLDG